MGLQDQIEEREVLDSIFPDEITDISESEFRISVTLDVPGGEADNEAEPHDARQPPHFVLHVRYPQDYPDAPPHLDMLAPPGAAPSPHGGYFSVADDREQLLLGLESTMEENLGMAMIFTLVSALKEAAEQLIMDRRAVTAAEIEESRLAAEREENKKFHGTAVTPESFLKWREAFIKEMADKERKQEERLAELKRAKVKEPVKLTGRQLWERGLAGKGEDGDDDDDDAPPVEGVQKLQVEASS
ncbi:hypothetical protein CDD82_2811 [Ophiocordyceps australis]|uniref:RWD domain-containing protein n=1 Tax=Ophiocordyceps australis TaxID=1399860 RepID=A0A2C5ZGJ4_9HYPO|nr:hypothetical protein CDD82_2811 [Ophiocordyceps australis]